jgi:DNA repair protein RecO (recombination protein O)
MIQRLTGIVLRTYRLTESSLIVHWLTAEQGRLATVAKGALRPRSPLRGKLDLFFKADLSLVRSRRSELHTLREVSVLDTRPALRHDLAWLRQAAYAAALIEYHTEPEAPVPGIYALLDGLLEHLPRQPASPTTLLAFELKLLGELGLSPNPAQAPVSAGTREILRHLATSPWAQLPRLQLSSAQQAEISLFLHRFLSEHLSRVPPNRNAALGLNRADLRTGQETEHV